MHAVHVVEEVIDGNELHEDGHWHGQDTCRKEGEGQRELGSKVRGQRLEVRVHSGCSHRSLACITVVWTLDILFNRDTVLS